MFTDIEGSTRLHQRLGEEFASLITCHDQLLGKIVNDGGGCVLTTMGDGLFAAFSDAGEALCAAAEIQRAVATQAWPCGIELRVRVGLHRGPAQPRDGNYVALAVHQAARVTAAAYGGQVLITDEVRLAGGSANLEDLGAYRLKDFDDPVRLHQLLIDGLEAPRPTGTRATPAAAHNVPDVRTSFLGRDRELSQLAAMFSSEARLVSMLGPGGVGKTRLAFELVKQVAPSYSDGGWVVLLANATHVEEIDDRVLSTLRVPERSDMTPRQSLLAALGQRETLLLLDNTEQVSNAVAGLVQDVLDECPGVRMLITSRQPLGLAGEVEWRLPPLPVHGEGAESDSLELFVQRALARNPKVMFGADDRHVIEDICRQVDGLPLGIELAAGRLRHMKLTDLAARLHERLHKAPALDPTVDERQRTLHALVDWSYQLLSEPAQALLRCMSIFQGSVPLEAVEALADPGENVNDALADLVDKSLINFDDDADYPYRLLVTIRHFALERLGKGNEAAHARRRHARYHLELARGIWEGLFGPQAGHWLDVADHVYDDLVAAMGSAEGDRDGETLAELARIVARCLYYRGRLTEARAALIRAERVPASPQLRSLLLAHGATLLALRGESEHAKQWAEQALELALDSPDEDLILQARWAFATTLATSGDLAAARQQIEAASHLSGTRIHRAEIEMLKATLALDSGDTHEAIAGFRSVDAEFLACGYLMPRPTLLCNLAESLTATGQLDEADRVLTEAMALTSSNERTARMHVLLELGRLALTRGDRVQAAATAQEALTLAEQDGHALVIEQIEISGLRQAIQDAGIASPGAHVDARG